MIGDRIVGETFYFNFTTRAFATGIPTVLAGIPVLSVIEDDNGTPITAGLTLGVDHASVVGLNNVEVVATGANGFEAGKDYSVYISTGTVLGVSVVGEVVGKFSLGLASAFTRLGAPAGASVSADIATIVTALSEAEILVQTTIATLASQVSFTLTVGSTDDLAYPGAMAVITDASTTVQKAVGLVSAYDGGTKRITLVADPNVFLMAATDKITLIAIPKSLPAALPDGVGGLPISDAGGLDMDALALEATVAALNNLSAADVNAEVDTALADIHLDHLLAAAAADVVVDGSVIAHMVSATEDWSTFVPSTDSLQALRDALALEATVAALNDLSIAQVATEISDAWGTDTVALPGQEAPPLTPTRDERAGHLYKAYRNRKTQTATQWSLLADDESTVDQKATVSDDATTAIKQEIVSGP